jgi:hypothetical protein
MKTSSAQLAPRFPETAAALDRLFLPLVAVAIAASLVIALLT